MSYLDPVKGLNFKYSAADLGTAKTLVTGTAVVRGGSADVATYQGVGVAFMCQSFTGTGTATPVVYESDDGLTFGTVAATDLTATLSTIAGIGSATMSGSNDNTPQVVGYIGSKRYIAAGLRATGTPTCAISGHIFATGRGVASTTF